MKKNIISEIFTVLFLVIATRAFRYVFWNTIFPPTYHIEDFFYLGIIFFGFFCSKNLNSSEIWGGRYLRWSIILPLISELFKPLLLGGSSLSEVSTTLGLCAGLSLFFVFYRYNSDIKNIIKIIVIYSIIGFIIQYGENFLDFPVLFGVLDENSELRNRYDTIYNVYNFAVCAQLLPIFCIYVFWSKYIETGKWLNLFPLAIFVVFLYLLQNRQTLISVIATFLFTPFLSQRKVTKKYSIVILIAAAVFFLDYSDVLFGSMIQNTNADDESWVTRMVEIPFFLNLSFENPIGLLLGHGFQVTQIIEKGFLMYACDVGFVGQIYQYGIFFVILYFVFLFKVFKERKRMPLLSLFFIFSSTIHSLFIFPYTSAITGFLWGMIIYYANISMSNTKKNLGYN